jgi:catechol 2,3-dioxygenase-like lactoylglutathione lyase family enzyme
MIGYITLGTNDIERAGKFYDELFAPLGAKRGMQNERFIGWSTGAGSPMFAVIKPFDGKPATAGNGTMISIFVADTKQIDALHAKALALGGKDEGAPGPRGDGSFYGGYFRDLDGNKLVFFKM